MYLLLDALFYDLLYIKIRLASIYC